ncbi:hypothetical protein FPE01S_01_11580 [Flavihumibacter petaseus NBRC 106054]|uniref:FAS1 domain-containing protein n=2 Tax=Flavihumibacter TaxID=1004301 RepID=A0A0E9MYD8_9BACT|nr:hypothetical protein FPE01S_01_11580 [Flavihumibacter petaseus NBRC 106054]
MFSACKRDEYFIGGTLHQAKVDMTTYDFLQSNSQKLFDTLLLLVDKAGIKDKINEPGITFFAPTDYSINKYLAFRESEEQNIDEGRRWTIDSMIKYELPMFADSIDLYRIPNLTPYDQLKEEGEIYPTLFPGGTTLISFEETRDPDLGYNSSVSTIPRIVYYTLQPDGDKVRVQTSGIQSNTGMIQVLNNQHTLFFRN